MPIFGDFLNSHQVYEDMKDIKALRKFVEQVALPAYNATPGCVPMNLVFFREAIEHVARIARVISQPKGNMMIVGIGQAHYISNPFIVEQLFLQLIHSSLQGDMDANL